MKRFAFVGILGLSLAAASSAFAMNWGSLKDDGCRSAGFRQFSAVLWNIPNNANWELACASAPVLDWGAPTRCVNQSGIKMWGEWDRPDPTCF